MVIEARSAAKRGKSRHDEIIGCLLRPIWLVRGSLLDHQWVVRLHSKEMTFDFDKAITPWPEVKTLIHPDLQNDLITAKLLVFNSLKPRPLGWNAAVTSVAHTLRCFTYFVRWRVECGLTSNSQLTPEWFDEFDRAFKSGGRQGLLPFTSRAASVFAGFDSGKVEFILNSRKAINSLHFSRLLGLDDIRTFPKEARRAIDRLLEERNLHVSRAPVRRASPVNASEAEWQSSPSDETDIEIIDTDHLESELKPTLSAAYSYYKVWLDLWRLRDKLSHDVIGFRPFSNKRALSHHVNNGGFPEPGRTGDAPAYQTSYLINSALTLILDPLVEQSIEIVEGLAKPEGVLRRELVEKLNSRLITLGFPELKPVYYESRGRSADDLMTIHDFVFKVLLASARIIMAAYSARRDEEIRRTKLDCIEVDDHEDHWLRCFINKNVNAMDRIPVPTSVARAAAIVARVRALGGKPTDRLFDFCCPVLKRAVKFDLGAVLDRVSEYFGVPPLEDGTAWHFTPHQFRKFFGVTYYWRWAFPNLTALTLQYRHFNPDTTRGYIELKSAEALRMQDEKLAAAERRFDIERKVDFDSGHSEFVTWVLRGVAEGRLLSGAMGKRINEMVESLVATFSVEIDITSTEPEGETFDQALQRLVGSISIAVNPEGHSLCCMGSKIDPLRHQQAVSQCLLLRQRITGQPASMAFSADPAFAEDVACAVCALRARLPEMMPYWNREMERVNEALVFTEGEQQAVLMERARIIKNYA